MLGRARTWGGNPLSAFDGLTRASALVRPVNPGYAATLLAEATLPAAMSGRIDLVTQVARQAEELWDARTAAADEASSLTVLAILAEAFVIAGDLDRAARYRRRAETLPPATLLPSSRVSRSWRRGTCGQSATS